MSYSSLPLTYKLFQLTSLSCALALAGCGGGDGVDSIAPVPDTGPQPGTGNGDGETPGGGETPGVEQPDFNLQELTVSPPNVMLSDEPSIFTVTVKAVATADFSSIKGQSVQLKIMSSGENDGALTIEGSSTQTTNEVGEAVYNIKLNPQAVKNEAELLTNGFKFQASATKSDKVVITQDGQVRFYKEGNDDGSSTIESQVELDTKLASTTLSSNALNVYGDKAKLTIIAINEKGVRAKNVTTKLTLVPVKGVSITGGNSKKTDIDGVVSFDIIIDSNLSKDEKDTLLRGITYYINVVEETGATKQEVRMLPVALPESDYELKVTGNTGNLNAYGGEKGGKQQLIIKASAKNTKVPTVIGGATATITLNNNIEGVTLSRRVLTLDENGQATVDLAIAEGLSVADRKKLRDDGISYTVTLSEPNRSTTTQTFKSSVYIPTQQYKINFSPTANDKKILYSSGGEASFTFRVNDKSGGTVSNQAVTVELPIDLVTAGLLTLNGQSEQTTDNKGEVSFTVKIPENLSEGQKKQLEDALSFALIAKIKEPLGITSEASSARIRIESKIIKSDIKLTANTNPTVITPLDKTFTLQIAAKRADGIAADGREVKLVLDEGEGVTIIGGSKPTNDFGIAEFTIQINQNLSQAQRDALIISGIKYTAVLTDKDNTQAVINRTIQIAKPATAFQFGTMTAQSISELGGDGNINVKILSKSGSNQSVEGQNVTIQLGSNAQRYGVTVTSSTEATDFEGNAIFVVNIPKGLSAVEREALKSDGINYRLSYTENGISYNSTAQSVPFTTLFVDLTVLNAPNFINNRPFYTLNGEGDTAVIRAGLSTQMTSFKIAGQPIQLAFENAELAALLNVNGKLGSATNIVSTDADGVVSFTVIVPNNLTQDEKNKLKNQKLTATLTETLTGKKQEIQFNIQSTKAAIDLIPIQPKPLNLNGGETQIEVIAKDSKDNVIAGQKVFLALPAAIASQGVILTTSGTQTTNDSGKAIFTIAVPSGLTEAQKNAIGSSFAIALTAADANGNIASRVSQVTTINEMPSNGTQENLSIGANKIVNTKGDTFKVFVRVANNKGSIANRDVRLNVDEPIKTGVTVINANGTAKTNSDGVAIFDLKLETGANVNEALLEAGIRLTATTTTAEKLEITQDYIVAVDTATIDSYQILASSDKSTLNTGGDQTNATFRVTDSSGGILVGVPVQLSIENLAASGAALTTPSIVLTDAEGKINVGILLAANSVNARLNHSVVIAAKIVTPQYDVNGNVSMQVREENSLSLSATGTRITLAASATQLKDGEATTITTTLIDGTGRAIANAGMELVDASGSSITANSTTDADGKVSFNINESNLTFDSNGNLRIFARALGEGSLVTQRSTSSIDLVKVSRAGISFSDIVGLYDVSVPNTINVQIRTDTAVQATALIGKMVEVQTTIGTFVNGKVITTRAITANDIDSTDSRIINIPVQLTSELAGTTVLQAIVLGEMTNGTLKYQTTVDTRFRATTPAKMLFQAVKSVITPGGSTEIVATVKDKNDVPVEGETVVFSRTADSSAGRLSAATAITNNKGEARVVYQANASSPIGGVVINARLLIDNANIGTKTTNITVSEEAVYTTLAFSNALSSDNIYYTAQASISVMDGSGRAVPNREVSIKSYAIEYAQGRVCLLESSYSYLGSFVFDFSEVTAVFLRSNWLPTEDPEYNYTLDKDADININDDNTIGNGRLDPINPVAIIGGTVSSDGYTFVTDAEGRADFNIRYPLRYSNWTKVRFDSSTFVNGSENTQSINYVLPSIAEDVRVVNSTLITPWTGDASPFGTGGAKCATRMSVTIDPLNQGKTTVRLSPYDPGFSVQIDGGKGTPSTSNTSNSSIYIVDFNKAYSAGSIVSVSNNGFSFSKTIKLDDN